MWSAPLHKDGLAPYAVRIHEPGSGIDIMVMCARDGEKRRGLVEAWHPSLQPTRLTIDDFDDA